MKKGDKVLYNGETYDYGYESAVPGKSVIYREDECNIQDSYAVYTDKLTLVEDEWEPGDKIDSKKKENKIQKYDRKAMFAELKSFDFLADDGDFIEITEWYNGEGFDVEISSKISVRFQLTWGEFKAMKKLIKKLEER